MKPFGRVDWPVRPANHLSLILVGTANCCYGKGISGNNGEHNWRGEHDCGDCVIAPGHVAGYRQGTIVPVRRTNDRCPVLEDEIVSFAESLQDVCHRYSPDGLGQSSGRRPILAVIGDNLDSIWPVIAQGALIIAALTLWGSAYRYRHKKGPISPDDGPGMFTPVWRMNRWLEPRDIRLMWWGNLAFAAATVLAYFASQQK